MDSNIYQLPEIEPVEKLCVVPVRRTASAFQTKTASLGAAMPAIRVFKVRVPSRHSRTTLISMLTQHHHHHHLTDRPRQVV